MSISNQENKTKKKLKKNYPARPLWSIENIMDCEAMECTLIRHLNPCYARWQVCKKIIC